MKSSEIFTIIKDIIIPITTFLLGLSFSVYFRYSDRKRKIDNIKKVLYKEMKDNYLVLHNLHILEGTMHDIIGDFYHYIPYLSNRIYDTYFEHLNVMKNEDFEKILNAYRETVEAKTLQQKSLKNIL